LGGKFCEIDQFLSLQVGLHLICSLCSQPFRRLCGSDKEGVFLTKKIMLVFGTRPEAIKMCPIINELKNCPNIKSVVCVTGQHREMLQQVLDCFSVRPDYDLALMQEGQNLFDITSGVLNRIKSIYEIERPDLVLVQGDTTSAFSSALAAFYMGIPVGHVEAGLRTYDMHAPYPEEFNRQAIGSMAELHFAPTTKARDNLLREGKDPATVFVTGNTAIDALSTTICPDYHHPELDWAEGSRLVLLTAHRRENLGEPLYRIFRGIQRVLAEHPEVKLIYPVHLNPVVTRTAQEVFGGDAQVHLIPPLDVLDFHNFLARADMILTDSGGIQEEAPSLGKPVLVLRQTTERPEGVQAGTLKLVGNQEEDVYQAFKQLLEDKSLYDQMSRAANPYGDGTASRQIVDILRRKL
jgi:UDP-N-acetylglucosamine 2-epimerase (non-hydrolysing)